jgi:uncharacterized protein
MRAYVDSSVILRIVFAEKNPLQITKKLQYVVSNEILKIECFRTIDRMRHTLPLSDDEVSEKSALLHQAIQSIKFVKFDDFILERASQPFPITIKTLDAIHLATAILWQNQEKQSITFLTHDVQQAKTAKAMGFEVLGCD